MKEATLGENGPARRRLTATLGAFEGSRLLDLRIWYLDKATKEFHRTKKGVSLTKENYVFLRELFISRHEEIASWLDVEFVPSEILKEKEISRMNLENARLQIGAVDHRVAAGRAGMPFAEIKSEGGRTVVVFSEAHPLYPYVIKLFRSEDSQQSAFDVVGLLLSAFERACISLGDTSAVSASALFQELKVEWSRALGRHLERGEPYPR